MAGSTIDREELSRFCLHHGIRRLSLFGSVLGDRFGPDSDVDVLVEFEPGVKVGFIRLAEIEEELSVLIGRPVDLRTPAGLSRYFRERVMRMAQTQYARG